MEILKTRQDKPPRILIHADHGLGKSSLAAAAPNPIFINLEEGLDEIDTQALPHPESFAHVLDQLRWVYSGEHDRKTLVIDTVDWLETSINKYVCASAGQATISDFDFGAGYDAAHTHLVTVMTALKDIWATREMAIILLCHSAVKEYKNPTGSNYDTYKLKLRDKNAELFMEFVTLVGFLHFKVYLNTKKGGFGREETKAIGGTDRILSCFPNAAYSAKNRYGILQDIELPDPQTGWNNLVKAIKGE